MKKWNVTITFTIQANTKTKAWDLAKELIDKHLRNLADVHSVDELPNPEGWIAINEPIMSEAERKLREVFPNAK